MSMPRLKLEGRRYGRLLITAEAGLDKWGATLWHCRCDCGTEKAIGSTALRGGEIVSCGCRLNELRSERASGPRQSLADRFWPKVDKSGKCWLWTASLDENGYGSLGPSRDEAPSRRAHRIAWRLTKGPIPRGLVLHRCGVRRCVNPEHLYIGDQSANMHDRWRDARERSAA